MQVDGAKFSRWSDVHSSQVGGRQVGSSIVYWTNVDVFNVGVRQVGIWGQRYINITRNAIGPKSEWAEGLQKILTWKVFTDWT